MSEAPDQLAGYLARIGLAETPRADAAGLLEVQAAQRQHIPFESLSIHLGEGVACDSASVFAKLVERRRGGFCFEHNQLLADMLAAAGFDVRLLLARVLLGSPPDITPRTHCLVLVTIEGEDWIADAGFGGSYAPPMRLADGELAQSGDGARHRLRKIGEDGQLPGAWVLERIGPVDSTDGRARDDSNWEAQFAFDMAQVAPADMALGCHWAATHPSSRFCCFTVVSRCLPDGFVSLVDRQFSQWRKGATPERREIASPAEYRALLSAEFGLDFSESEVARLPIWE